MPAVRTVLASLAIVGSSWAQVTERVSLNSNGHQAAGGGDLPISNSFVSADGTCVAFISGSGDLVPGDTNGAWDVFVHNRKNGITERVDINSEGWQANGTSGLYGIAMTPDGRFVAFGSGADNLVPGDTNGAMDIFVRDRYLGTTVRASVSTTGTEANDSCFSVGISANGRYVGFDSLATNLVPLDTNHVADVFVRDLSSGRTTRVSVSSTGAEGDRDSGGPTLSADGRFVAFYSEATNLVAGDTNSRNDVFLRDVRNGTTTRVSVATDGSQGNGDSFWPSISADGRYVVYTSEASNLVPGDTNGTRDVFLFDGLTGRTERVSVADSGAEANHGGQNGVVTDDGRYVAFYSSSTNLIPGDSHGGDIFVRDRLIGTTARVSVTTGGSTTGQGYSDMPSISAGGRYVVFRSSTSDLVPGDTNGSTDVFIHDRFAAGLTLLCEPGASSVIGCPCSNPPSAPGRGCDNSSATGGATLGASGIAYLSFDDLTFTTSGEGPTATSVLFQGDAVLSNGAVYGQGVRCTGGRLERLFVRQAVSGGVRMPDFGAGDRAISIRSASLGDEIQPGHTRWYFVAYRDPIVLGGCAATSTFNSTPTGSVSWWP